MRTTGSETKARQHDCTVLTMLQMLTEVSETIPSVTNLAKTVGVTNHDSKRKSG